MSEPLPIEQQMPVAEAIARLRDLPLGSICILGVDGFTEPLRPSLDHIADFSTEFMTFGWQEAESSVERAIATLSHWPPTMPVELVARPTVGPMSSSDHLTRAEGLVCPRCGGAMVPGRLRVKGTIPGFLFAGISWQHLWWSDPEETRPSRQKIIISGEQRPADRCIDCGMIAFMPWDIPDPAD